MAVYPGRGLHGEVVALLGLRIIRGDYPPGSIIDIDGLEPEFGVSKTVVREALRVLGRPFVTTDEFTHPGPRRFIGWQIDTSLFSDPQSLRDTFEVHRPSSDFAALAFLPCSTADVTAS